MIFILALDRICTAFDPRVFLNGSITARGAISRKGGPVVWAKVADEWFLSKKYKSYN
jgi:hypothetical protein